MIGRHTRMRSTPGALSALRRARAVLLAAIAVTALLGSACAGGDDSSDGDGNGGGDGGDGTESTTPVAGGELVYGLEAENANGWCLPEGQLDFSGIIVARAIYDTLTVPNAEGDYVPFLAESIEPNETFDQWTITVRDGVTFHDGTALDATVLKNNLDAYRGQYEGRQALLFMFLFENIADVEVVDDMTVSVTTKTPWPGFPAAVWGTGRIGIMAQAQLDDPATCDTKLIGTGPFVQQEWVQNDHFSATKNPDYWQQDADGNRLPYLDSVEFRPMPESAARTNALLGGSLNAMATSSADSVATLEAEADAGTVKLEQSSDLAEVAFGMFNTEKPPFDNKLAREAAVMVLDRELMNEVINQDLFELANGPFAPGAIGYLDDTGWPDPDPDRARELLEEYQDSTGRPLEFTFTIVNTPEVLRVGQFVQEQADEFGITVNLETIDQATLISRAIAGDFEAITFRNHPGGGPDTQYPWWYGNSLLNFGGFDDPEINELLDQGRVEPDPAKQQEIYAEINREFATEFYNLWLNWTEWTIATDVDVYGIVGPSLPDGSDPSTGFGAAHSLAGAWMEP